MTNTPIPIRNGTPKKAKTKTQHLTYDEAVALIPDTRTVKGLVQKGLELQVVIWPRARALETLKMAPVDSISLIEQPTAKPPLPRMIAFLRKSTGTYFYAFIETIPVEQPAPVVETAAVNA